MQSLLIGRRIRSLGMRVWLAPLVGVPISFIFL